jgi:amino acid transporter
MVKVMIAMSAIFIFYGVNMMGLKLSAKTQSVLMLIKISMILLLISALFLCLHLKVLQPQLWQMKISAGKTGYNLLVSA